MNYQLTPKMRTQTRNQNAILYYLLKMLAIGLLVIVPLSTSLADEKIHRIVMQISSGDPARMNLILNNASNINKYYLDKGEEAKIEIVAYGPGLTMLRGDKSPVKKRVKTIAQNFENVSFKACNNTLQKLIKKEKKKDIPLLPEAKIVPSGVIHLIQRQEEGWTYIKP